MSDLILEKGPYIFNVNNLFSEANTTDKAKRILLELKNCLVALGGQDQIWTVVASSNGVDFVNIGGTEPLDLWNSISDIVFAANGTAHSWCILENVFTGQQIIITPNSIAVDQVNIVLSPDGLIASDGTETTNPTCTDYGLLWSADNSFTSTDSNYLKFVINVMSSADYTITRFYLHERNSLTDATGGMIGLIENVQNTPEEWNSEIKFVMFEHGTSVAYSTTPSTKTPTLSYFDGDTLSVRYQTAAPYNEWLNAYPTCECYGALYPDNRADPVIQNATNQVSPIGIFKPANPKGGAMGRLTDIYLGQSTHDTLTTYPATGSRLWVKWGCFVVPWNGTPPQDAI